MSYKIKWKDWPEVTWVLEKYLGDYEKEIEEYKTQQNSKRLPDDSSSESIFSRKS